MVAIDFFPWLNVLGFLILGLSYIFVQWRYGQNKASVEVIETYKEQVYQLREQVNNLSKELGILEGVVKEKDSQIKTYLAILQNRNPEMEAFIQSISKVANDATAFMKDMGLTMTTLKEDINLLMEKADRNI